MKGRKRAAAPDLHRVPLTGAQVYALAEVAGRVTVRQLRAWGLDPSEFEDLDEAHARLVAVLEHAAAADPRQLVMELRDEARPRCAAVGCREPIAGALYDPDGSPTSLCIVHLAGEALCRRAQRLAPRRGSA